MVSRVMKIRKFPVAYYFYLFNGTMLLTLPEVNVIVVLFLAVKSKDKLITLQAYCISQWDLAYICS